MKKRIYIFILCAVVACVSVGLCGCTSKDDCIPEELGKAEGLYLYNGNYRSLTDGRSLERILNEITHDGVAYTDEEYEIYDIDYMTDCDEIIYSISTSKEDYEEQYLLWHYNYDTKQSGLVRTFDEPFTVMTSESLMLVDTSHQHNYTREGFLYDGEFNVVQDGLYGYRLWEDTAYKPTIHSFEWWKDGNHHSITVDWKILNSETVMYDGYVYMFGNGSAVMCVANLSTGEYEELSLGEDLIFETTSDGRHVVIDGYVYFTTHKKATEDERLKHGFSLYKVRGSDLQRTYAFQEKYEVRFKYLYNDEYINFSMRYQMLDSIDTKKAYFKVEKQALRRNRSKEIEIVSGYYEIAGYKFYISRTRYGAGEAYCHYLHRITGDKDEILRYSFKDEYSYSQPNHIFFDDIHDK